VIRTLVSKGTEH